MSRHIKVYGLKDEEIKSLESLAMKETGDANISRYLRNLILSKIGGVRPNEEPTNKTNRIEIRIDESTKEKLSIIAENEKMTPNAYVRMLVQKDVDNLSVLTKREIEALYQSNAQLLMIGRNINQIAKNLNASHQSSITSQNIDELKDSIKKHITVVSDLISSNYERL